MDMSVQRGIYYYSHHTDQQSVVKLKWVHVEGAFAMLTIGLLAATLVFMIEMLI